MKLFKLFLIVITAAVVTNSCQKGPDTPNNIIAEGGLVQDAGGNCSPAVLNGIYKVNSSLNGTNYMDVTVNITVAGDYKISTDNINGIQFGDSAQFATTGMQLVRLKGYGKPAAAGSFPFTVRFGSSVSCVVPVTVSAVSGPPAAFTFSGAPGTCTAPTIIGAYTVGTALGTSNKLVLGVNVTVPGDYSVNTATINGINFSAAGTFNTTGNQTIVLSGSGTPAAVGTFSLMVSGTATSCSFSITVDPLPSPDPAKLILIASKDGGNGSGALNVTNLTCYNFDRTVKWRRTNLGNTAYRSNGIPGNVLYENGIVYFCQDSIYQVGVDYFTLNRFFALDANTGNDIWTKRSLTDQMQFPMVANGIIYCNLQQGTTNSIAAYNAATGALLWATPIAEQFGADAFIVDGDMLYFYSVKNPSEIFLNGFDISTKTWKWKIPFGANFFRTTTAMLLNGSMLYARDAINRVVAIDKTSGTAVWNTPANYSQVFNIANNLLYIADAGNNINALSLTTGVKAYSWSTGVSPSYNARIYREGQNLYFSGIDTAGYNFITSVHSLNMGPNWRAVTTVYGRSPVVTGNIIYTVQLDDPTAGPTMYMFDSNSGAYINALHISGYNSGDIRIVTAAGKFISPF